MLITLRIWFWVLVENTVWYTGGIKVSILRQKRHRIRLEKAKEKETLALQKEAVTNWRDGVILYRMITSRFAKTMFMW